jgi:hypothetical protein
MSVSVTRDENEYEDRGARSHTFRKGRQAHISELTPMDIILSGSVEMSYAVRVVGPDGTERELEARVEFPDDARSLLEAASWRDGASILDVLARVAVRCIRRLEASKLVKAGNHGTPVGARIQASLSDVRSIVAEYAA